MTWPPNSSTRSVPYRLQQACFKRDHWTCQDCGYQGTPNTGDLHADHNHNRAEGGADELTNLVTRCVPCHNTKTKQERARGITRRTGKRRPRVHPADAYSKHY